MLKERKYCSDVSVKDEGKKVTVAGWLYETRELGKLKFVILRDVSGDIQITGFKGETEESVFQKMGKTTRESVIVVEGKVKKSPKASGGRELTPEKFEVISPAESPLPLDVSDRSKTDMPKRLDYRFLDFHNRRTQAVFKIQSTISSAFRDFFVKEKFIDMQPPCVIGQASEGGTDLFEVKYFEKKAYLAQSPQLYKQMLACSMEKIFMITPVWRAEKHNTVRHINEIRQMDIEVAFEYQMGIMKYLERVMQHIVKSILEENKDEIEFLGLKLKVPSAKYLHYDECIELLKKNKIKIIHGEDLNPEAEKKLGELFPDCVVFVHSWPAAIKPFYIMPKDEKAKAEYSEGFDAIYRGLEISSGGQRIHIPELLIEKIKAKELKPEQFKDYIDSFRYGAPPHSGWSIGLERLTMLICQLDNVKEATMFPRDRDRLTP